MKINAEFITSAARAGDFPTDGLGEIAIVGRSNVGKSSLINALLRQRIARTSAAPGKTRLANIYRIQRGASPPLHLVDLPGYGFAKARREIGGAAPTFDEVANAAFERHPAALLLVDVRHPGLENDRNAWQWLVRATDRAAVVATKIDKVARGQRIRALRELESVFEHAVLPVSAVTGEGMDELWKLIDKLVNNPNINPRRRPSIPPREMAPHRSTPSKAEGRKR